MELNLAPIPNLFCADKLRPMIAKQKTKISFFKRNKLQVADESRKKQEEFQRNGLKRKNNEINVIFGKIKPKNQP